MPVITTPDCVEQLEFEVDDVVTAPEPSLDELEEEEADPLEEDEEVTVVAYATVPGKIAETSKENRLTKRSAETENERKFIFSVVPPVRVLILNKFIQ